MTDFGNRRDHPHVMIHLNGNEGGGVRTMVESWHGGFRKNGVRVSYLANRYGDYTRRLEKEGREFYCVNMGKLKSRSWHLFGVRLPDLIGWTRSAHSSLRSMGDIERILRKVRPDVVLGNGAGSAAVVGPACKNAGVDMVSCLHGISHPNDFMSIRKRIIAFLMNRYCVRVVGVSHETLKSLLPFLRIPHRVIHNSVSQVDVDEEKGVRLREQWGIEEECVVIGNASRVSPTKAVHRFVEAAEILLRRNPEASVAFLVAGKPQSALDHAYLDDILKKIEVRGLQRAIRFVGFQPIADFYSAINVFCHTRQDVEPLGLTIVEALSAGLPVVVCDKGGFLEFLPDDLGVRYDGASPEKLAEAMEAFLDEKFRKEQSTIGRVFFEEKYISYSQWIRSWLDALFEI